MGLRSGQVDFYILFFTLANDENNNTSNNNNMSFIYLHLVRVWRGSIPFEPFTRLRFFHFFSLLQAPTVSQNLLFLLSLFSSFVRSFLLSERNVRYTSSSILFSVFWLKMISSSTSSEAAPVQAQAFSSCLHSHGFKHTTSPSLSLAAF